jgi:hypothetical protein
MHMNFWLESMKGSVHLKDLGEDGRMVLMDLGKLWTGFIWLTIGAGGKLL